MEKSYIENHTIFETVIGSHAYGTHNEDSDYDKAGVVIPGIEYFYSNNRFDQYQDYPGEDKTMYNIIKAIKLISENNPNMMDLLAVPESCHIIVTRYWEKVIENKDLFISKKSKFTFSGYAISQLNRIKTHRSYLLNPPKAKPERTDFGLPEFPIVETAQLKALINVASLYEYIEEEKKETFVNDLDTIYAEQVIPLFAKNLKEDRKTIALEFLQTGLQNQLNTFLALGNNSYIKEEYREIAEKELQYTNALKDWNRYQEWKKSRNKKRAPLEEKFGYDTKHAMHLVRLLRMGKEILTTGKIHVDRRNIDSEELVAIRNGLWSYDQIEEYASNCDKELDVLYKESTLQNAPDINKIHKLTIEIIDDYHTNEGTN